MVALLRYIMRFQITSTITGKHISFMVRAKHSNLRQIIMQKLVNKDDSLDNYLRAILEEFRNAMTVGIPEINIPILDPFEVPHFDIPHIE